jgi:aquaporin Z
MNKYLTEAVGTFFLVLTIGLTGSPLAIGAGLMVMVYMGGHISGAHYNPAVTLAVFWRGRLPGTEVGPYMISQFIGAILASLGVYVITGKTFGVAPSPSASMGAALLVEILYTFALVLVILNVATSRKTEGNSYYGLAIGAAVMAGAFAGGGVSGGAFNPAVGIGPPVIHAMFGEGGLSHAWLYVVGPVLGAAFATTAFKLQRAD